MATYRGGEVQLFKMTSASSNIVWLAHALTHTMNYTTDKLVVGTVETDFSDIISIFQIDGVKIIIVKNISTASLDESSNSESEET